ncbi:MAG: cytochrome c biogenesis protein CcdA [Actinobacteria bacterium]|nr:cytochrome c biogenesis protein CcdA [Actinomycetota bacterium]
MNGLALAYVFGLGMVAVFNPCGFAMLPAYVGFFLATDEDFVPFHRRVGRALSVGASVTAGFVALFLVVGLVIQLVAGGFVSKLPWVSIVLGLAMTVLGVSMLMGRKVMVRLPFNPRGPSDQRYRSMFGFGVSYALVSCVCTIPLFLASVTTSLTRGNLVVGTMHFVAYAAGMGLVLIVLALSISLARNSIVGRMRRVLPHVERLAAGLLVIAGVYVTYYGWYSLRVYNGDTSVGGPAEFVYGLSGQMSSWIQAVGPGRIGLVLAGIVIASAVLAVGYRSTEPHESGAVGSRPEVRPPETAGHST